jgi:hypothetical protein
MIVFLGIVFVLVLIGMYANRVSNTIEFNVSNRDVWAMMHVDQKPNGMHLESQFRHKESKSETQKMNGKSLNSYRLNDYDF